MDRVEDREWRDGDMRWIVEERVVDENEDGGGGEIDKEGGDGDGKGFWLEWRYGRGRSGWFVGGVFGGRDGVGVWFGVVGCRGDRGYGGVLRDGDVGGVWGWVCVGRVDFFRVGVCDELGRGW